MHKSGQSTFDSLNQRSSLLFTVLSSVWCNPCTNWRESNWQADLSIGNCQLGWSNADIFLVWGLVKNNAFLLVFVLRFLFNHLEAFSDVLHSILWRMSRFRFFLCIYCKVTTWSSVVVFCANHNTYLWLQDAYNFKKWKRWNHLISVPVFSGFLLLPKTTS